jgi:hypothetical protein
MTLSAFPIEKEGDKSSVPLTPSQLQSRQNQLLIVDVKCEVYAVQMLSERSENA